MEVKLLNAQRNEKWRKKKQKIALPIRIQKGLIK